MNHPYTLILVSVVLSAAAQIVLKAGMMSPIVQQLLSGPVLPAIFGILFNPMIVSGLALYVGSAMVWLLVLSKVPVSTAYPFVALAIVLTAILGRVVFDDAVPLGKIVGIFLIVGGIVVMART